MLLVYLTEIDATGTERTTIFGRDTSSSTVDAAPTRKVNML